MPKAGIQFSKKDEWMTPEEVWKKFGPFGYDPATTEEQAEKMDIPSIDTIETDGLLTDWTEYYKIWCNPPFSRKFEFLEKAVDTVQKSSDTEIFFLLPIESMATKKFHEIMRGQFYTVYLPNGRIKFDDGSGKSSSPAFGSVVIRLSATELGTEIRHWRLYGNR